MHRVRAAQKKTFKHDTDQEKREKERRKEKIQKQIKLVIKEQLVESL